MRCVFYPSNGPVRVSERNKPAGDTQWPSEGLGGAATAGPEAGCCEQTDALASARLLGRWASTWPS